MYRYKWFNNKRVYLILKYSKITKWCYTIVRLIELIKVKRLNAIITVHLLKSESIEQVNLSIAAICVAQSLCIVGWSYPTTHNKSKQQQETKLVKPGLSLIGLLITTEQYYNIDYLPWLRWLPSTVVRKHC